MKIKLKIILAFVLFLILNTQHSIASNEPKEKTFIFSGKIIDLTHHELLAGVRITSTDCEKTIYSDLNGNFLIYVKIKDGQDFKLEFSQIGYNTKTLTIADLAGKGNNLEINLIEE